LLFDDLQDGSRHRVSNVVKSFSISTARTPDTSTSLRAKFGGNRSIPSRDIDKKLFYMGAGRHFAF